MADFLLSPFKAVYNLNTYIKATKQSAGKTLLFVVYLIILMSVLFSVGLFIKISPLDPVLTNLTNQFAQVIPDIEVKNGIINANNDEYFEIAPAALDQKIVFDTARTEPVYPTQLQQEHIAVLVTAQNIYIAQQGQMQTHKLDTNTNFILNKQVVLDNQADIIQYIKKFILLLALFLMPFVVIFLVIILLILAIAAMGLSQLFIKAELSFGQFCTFCFYMLAPALFFLLITILVPFDIPFVWLICFVLFMVYAQLILRQFIWQQNSQNLEE